MFDFTVYFPSFFFFFFALLFELCFPFWLKHVCMCVFCLSSGLQVDEITFECPVRVTHVRIVPLYVPDSKVPQFSGFTSPGSFQLDIFGGVWNQPQSKKSTRMCSLALPIRFSYNITNLLVLFVPVNLTKALDFSNFVQP